jgi:predicted Zn-dependent peptidase
MTFPHAGSANETIETPGAAFLNKWMSFKTSSQLSAIVINRLIEDAGGVPMATVNRKSATLGFTVPSEQAPSLVPIFALDCTFEKWDFKDALFGASAEIAKMTKDPAVVLTECLCSAAYGAQSLGGRTLYFSKVSVGNVAEFRKKTYVLNGAVLAATGVKDHSSFVAEVDASIGGIASDPISSEALFYLGGESRVNDPFAPMSRVAIAFPAPKSSVVAAVVKQFFNVVGRDDKVTASVSNDLLVVQTMNPVAGGLVDILVDVLKKGLTEKEFGRAKNLAKGEALFNLDAGSFSLATAATASVLETGTFVPGSVGKAYDAVTISQVKDAIALMLKSNPSVAAVGNISRVPYHATIASSFK